MSDLSLRRADALHRLIGRASIAVGLRALYLGALAYPVKEGASPAVRSGVWTVVRKDTEREGNGLEPAGEELFRISVVADDAANASASWRVTVDGAVVQLFILAVTGPGRAFLGPLKAELGAV